MDCDVGKHLRDHCSSPSSTRFVIPSDEEVQLISLRSGSSIVINVCQKHFKRFIKLFKLNEKSCCNPLAGHSTNHGTRQDLCEISLEQHHYYKDLRFNINTR